MARTNGSSAAIAAIAYAVTAEEGITFLRCWQQGEFETIRVDWPNAPEAVFIGVEPPELAQLLDVTTPLRSGRRLPNRSYGFWSRVHQLGMICVPMSRTRTPAVACVRVLTRTGER
jgi:hypothetical protein